METSEAAPQGQPPGAPHAPPPLGGPGEGAPAAAPSAAALGPIDPMELQRQVHSFLTVHIPMVGPSLALHVTSPRSNGRLFPATRVPFLLAQSTEGQGAAPPCSAGSRVAFRTPSLLSPAVGRPWTRPSPSVLYRTV